MAKKFGKRHDKLISEIERMYSDLIGKGCAQNGGEEKEIKEQLRHSFEYGLMNEEELDKEIKETSKQIDAIIPFISHLKEMLKKFGAKDKED